MNEITFPLQSVPTLIKATVVALIMAIVVFMTIVLPAEFNYDPTGVGSYLGLTVFAKETPVVAAAQPPGEQSPQFQQNQVTVSVPPNMGVEYKFSIQKYGNLSYEWATNGEPLYFDFHGEPKGDTSGYFESYAIATTHEMQGSMTVPFEGVHGWYWKNVSDKEIVVTLKTQGNYQVIGLIH